MIIILGKLFLVMGLVLANGFFVAAEFSLVAIRSSRVEELVAEGRPFASAVSKAIAHLDTYLAATQLGITMTSLALGWVGEQAISGMLEPLFGFLPGIMPLISAHTVAVVIAFAAITVLHIVFGELAPKSLALQRTEATALFIAKPLEFYLWVFRPVIFVLNGLGMFLIRSVGLHAHSESQSAYSVEELKILVKASRKAGVLSRSEQEIVESVFHLSDRRTNSIMTPRPDIFWLDIQAPPERLANQLANSSYPSFPIGDGSLDKVIGIVESKEILRQVLMGNAPNLRSVMQTPLFVPESMRVSKLLELFKNTKIHMVLVANEYGGIEGVVTLNDVLEALIGDMPSAHDESPQIQVQKDGSWMIDGLLSIEEFKELFKLSRLPDEEEFQTVGGFILKLMGRIPKIGDDFNWGGLFFKIKQMDHKRIEKVLVKPTRRS